MILPVVDDDAVHQDDIWFWLITLMFSCPISVEATVLEGSSGKDKAVRKMNKLTG